MPKYYCDYCKSYLTHDSTSVRKSHLVGKNHLKYVCDYYEREAKQLGIWNYNDYVKPFSLEDLYAGAPGAVDSTVVDEQEEEDETDNTLAVKGNRKYNNNNKYDFQKKKSEKDQSEQQKQTSAGEIKSIYEIIDSITIPPPPTLSNMPNPPPSVLRYSNTYTSHSASSAHQKKSSEYSTADDSHRYTDSSNGSALGATPSPSSSNSYTPGSKFANKGKFNNYNNNSATSSGYGGYGNRNAYISGGVNKNYNNSRPNKPYQGGGYINTTNGDIGATGSGQGGYSRGYGGSSSGGRGGYQSGYQRGGYGGQRGYSRGGYNGQAGGSSSGSSSGGSGGYNNRNYGNRGYNSRSYGGNY